MRKVEYTTRLLLSTSILLALISACATSKTKKVESKTIKPTQQTANRPSKAPATPYPIKHAQPNGDTLTIKLYGDEHHHWAETIDGYQLLQRKDGTYEYAYRNKDGNLVSTGIMATDIEKRDAKTIDAIEKCKHP